MPLYEYECQSCGKHFELLRSICQADQPAKCPACANNDSKRLISLVNAYSAGRNLGQGSASCSSCSSHNCGSCR
ncbi:MAG TPA: zinc ribbon domain-containing protein [Anaerolineaceae bacterium]|nr:zinc ribbon domain-containing protein [Anaerolineaceae bacterium]